MIQPTIDSTGGKEMLERKYETLNVKVLRCDVSESQLNVCDQKKWTGGGGRLGGKVDSWVRYVRVSNYAFNYRLAVSDLEAFY